MEIYHLSLHFWFAFCSTEHSLFPLSTFNMPVIWNQVTRIEVSFFPSELFIQYIAIFRCQNSYRRSCEHKSHTSHWQHLLCYEVNLKIGIFTLPWCFNCLTFPLSKISEHDLKCFFFSLADVSIQHPTDRIRCNLTVGTHLQGRGKRKKEQNWWFWKKKRKYCWTSCWKL